jgi:hypothetical protein
MVRFNTTVLILAGWVQLCSHAPGPAPEWIAAVWPSTAGGGWQAAFTGIMIALFTVGLFEGLAHVWRKP